MCDIIVLLTLRPAEPSSKWNFPYHKIQNTITVRRVKMLDEPARRISRFWCTGSFIWRSTLNEKSRSVNSETKSTARTWKSSRWTRLQNGRSQLWKLTHEDYEPINRHPMLPLRAILCFCSIERVAFFRAHGSRANNESKAREKKYNS